MEIADQRLFAREAVRVLQQKGHIAYFAGGCVRDELLGQAPQDYDIATNATPQRVIEIFPRTVPVGVQFGVVLVLGEGDLKVEIATFRHDGEYSDGRHPNQVTFGDPREDAKRRDFTVNGLFCDPISGRVLDYVGGREDLEARILRCIGDPSERLQEDKLRLLRAVRFTAHLGFTLDEKTGEAVRENAHQVRSVSPERIGDEMQRILMGRDPGEAVRLLHRLELLPVLLPELTSPDTALVDRAVRLLSCFPPRDLALQWALLLSSPIGIPTDVSKLIELCDRFRFSRKLRDSLLHLLLESSHRLDKFSEQAEASRRRLLADPQIEEMLLLWEAQRRVDEKNLDPVKQARKSLEALGSERALPPPLISGEDLKDLGLSPGPHFKTILEEVRDRQLEGRLLDSHAAKAYVKEARPKSRPADDQPGGRGRKAEG